MTDLRIKQLFSFGIGSNDKDKQESNPWAPKPLEPLRFPLEPVEAKTEPPDVVETPRKTPPRAPPKKPALFKLGDKVGLLGPKTPMKTQYAYYAAVARAYGMKVNPKGFATVLALRGLSRAGHRLGETTIAQRYSDTIIVLKKGRVSYYTASTHPAQARSNASPDVSGDGVGDVGMILAGKYWAHPNGAHPKSYGPPSYHVRVKRNGSQYLPGVRDTNHDGRFSTAERNASKRRGDRLSEVLVHVGNSSSPSSIGCPNVHPSEYASFVNAVGGSRAEFNFLVVDATK